MPRARHKAKGPKPTKDWREQANRMLGKRFLDLGSQHAAKQAAGQIFLSIVFARKLG